MPRAGASAGTSTGDGSSDALPRADGCFGGEGALDEGGDEACSRYVGEDTHQLEAGSSVCVPAGVAHTFSNPSDSLVRFLNFTRRLAVRTRCDFAEVAKTGPLTPDVIGRVPSRYDFHPA
jgi:hypothetical protein